MILAGDVGGTKTALALFEHGKPGGPRVAGTTLPSRDFPSLEVAVDVFLDREGRPEVDAACFGVAGVVLDGRCVTTNLPWVVDERRLAETIPAPRVRLLNDLEAAGHGVLALPPADLMTIQDGPARDGNKALIAAGTGLGEGLLIWDGTGYRVIATEGGHTDFAPRTDLEAELLAFLRAELGRVSYERVLSGPGLFNIYRFLRHRDPAPEPTWLRDRMAEGDPSAVVSEVGLAGEDPRCVTALDVFASVYGAEAGNLALKTLAVGGVIVGGGIAPKIRAKLLDGRFVEAFRAKGRLQDLMADIPVHLSLNVEAPLLGAARVAQSLLAVRSP
ncbi:MAG TPA: glucokinase [Candidatus Limnocylindrales bacterium]|nr:glucokinase [Candidatus Limnocylindrales bacterium]